MSNFEIENFSSPNHNKFAIYCDWNSKISQLGTFGIFGRKMKFFKISENGKFEVDYISDNIFHKNYCSTVIVRFFCKKMENVWVWKNKRKIKTFFEKNAFILSEGICKKKRERKVCRLVVFCRNKYYERKNIPLFHKIFSPVICQFRVNIFTFSFPTTEIFLWTCRMLSDRSGQNSLHNVKKKETFWKFFIQIVCFGQVECSFDNADENFCPKKTCKYFEKFSWYQIVPPDT